MRGWGLCTVGTGDSGHWALGDRGAACHLQLFIQPVANGEGRLPKVLIGSLEMNEMPPMLGQ